MPSVMFIWTSVMLLTGFPMMFRCVVENSRLESGIVRCIGHSTQRVVVNDISSV